MTASVTGRHSDRLLDQVEGDRADQHARAEGHDQPDHAQADAEAERDERADQRAEDAARIPQPNEAHI